MNGKSNSGRYEKISCTITVSYKAYKIKFIIVSIAESRIPEKGKKENEKEGREKIVNAMCK